MWGIGRQRKQQAYSCSAPPGGSQPHIRVSPPTQERVPLPAGNLQPVVAMVKAEEAGATKYVSA
jgi:hypothetical protein